MSQLDIVVSAAKDAVALELENDFGGARDAYLEAANHLRNTLGTVYDLYLRRDFEDQCIYYVKKAQEMSAKLRESSSTAGTENCSSAMSESSYATATMNPAQNIDSNMAQSDFGKCVMRDEDKTSFFDVCGLKEEKLALEQALILPILRPEWFSQGRRPARSILFYGPPGSGKTELAKAVAWELRGKREFISVKCSDLTSKYVGESEKLVRDFFKFAHGLGGAVVYMDEIDAICGRRIEQNDPLKGMKSEMLVQMQEALSERSNLFIMGSTNLPWDLDIATKRRFERLILVPLPELDTRNEMLKKLLLPLPSKISEADVGNLAEKTKGLSGADIGRLCFRARNVCIDKIQRSEYFRKIRRNVFTPCASDDQGAIQVRVTKLGGELEFDKSVTMEDVLQVLPTIKNCAEESYYRKLQDFAKKEGEGFIAGDKVASQKDINFMEWIQQSLYGL